MTQYDPIRKPSVNALVQSLKESGSDYEWYPTTDEMLSVVREDLRDYFCVRGERAVTASILDCGAGDGRALMALTEGDRYAIEKAEPLIDVMDQDIFIVDTDFHKQALLDKRVDAVFSNPPYSEYVAWTLKILKEANASVAYLVIPERWASNADIQDAIKARKAKVDVIGSFDFLEADRRARAKVDIVRVNLAGQERAHWFSSVDPYVDPFDLWFDENFPMDIPEGERSSFDQRESTRSSIKSRVADSRELVKDRGLVHLLEDYYYRDLEHLVSNYQSVANLDAELLCELGVNVRSLKEALKLKIKSLKDLFWRELFDNLGAVTDRLTSESRSRMLSKLMDNTSVDFNAQNAHALVIWMVKNANRYFDQQLIEVVERMVDHANIALYKANQRTFGAEQWRYCRRPDDLDRYALEYRVVLDRVGGLCNSEYSFERSEE